MYSKGNRWWRPSRPGAVELPRHERQQIKDLVSRQVLFSKHRAGLLKKAFEFTLLCDVEVTLLVFYLSGKLYEYTSTRFRFPSLPLQFLPLSIGS